MRTLATICLSTVRSPAARASPAVQLLSPDEADVWGELTPNLIPESQTIVVSVIPLPILRASSVLL